MLDQAAVLLEAVPVRWAGRTIVVAAPGPSLNFDDARRVWGADVPLVLCQDAFRIFGCADVLYGCEGAWWDLHRGARSFCGERWSTHGNAASNDKRQGRGLSISNDKSREQRAYGLRLVAGRSVNVFSQDPAELALGGNSGFQAINLAMLMGGLQCRILLIGFDMHTRRGRHFFGDHPRPLRNSVDYEKDFVPRFNEAARSMPPGVEIINCTPGSALRCFPEMSLEDALKGGG